MMPPDFPPPLSEATVVALYRETISSLYRFVSQRCDGDRALAEDITQETWLRAVRSWRESGVPSNPIGWLTTVARNLLLNQRRHRAMIALDAVDLEALDVRDSEPSDNTDEDVRAMHLAIARLPPQEAQLLNAFHFGQRRVAQLAQQLGITERAVEGRLRRARARLREQMKNIAHSEHEESHEGNG